MATAQGTTSDNIDLNNCKTRQGKHTMHPPPNQKDTWSGKKSKKAAEIAKKVKH